MNKIAKISVLAIGAAMVTSALHAQSDSGSVSDNDLVLGFTSQAAGVTSDYILDLGQVPATANTQLGGISLSSFNSNFGAAIAAGTVYVGVVGGAGDVIPHSDYTSTLRLTTDPTVAGAGTETAPKTPTSANEGNASQLPGTLGLGLVSQGDSSSWSYLIAQNPTTVGTAPLNHSFSGYLGSNPMTTLGSGEQITLDIWHDTSSSTKFTYVGDLQLDLTGSTLSAIWDPVAVPEPATYGLLAGGGLLALALRRQFRSKNA